MKKYNPVFIARNHIVEEAINEDVKGDMKFTNKLLEILSKCFLINIRII